MIRTLSFRSILYLAAALAFALGLVLALAPRASAASISSQMDIGARGDDVSTLQTFLAADPHLYPEGLVTGYYGPLTAKAVGQFQLYYGLPSVGRVGPLTIAKINSLMGLNQRPDVTAPGIYASSIAMSSTAATVSWSTTENARGTVYYSTSPIVWYETSAPFTQPTVVGASMQVDPLYKLGHSVSLSNLSSHTTYYYLILATDVAGNVNDGRSFGTFTTP